MPNNPIRDVVKRQEQADIDQQVQAFLAKGGAIKEHAITDRTKRDSEQYMLRRYQDRV